jgi:hypothetical protein
MNLYTYYRRIHRYLYHPIVATIHSDGFPAWHAPLRVSGHLTRVEPPETLVVHIARSRYMFPVVVCGLEACR